MFGFGSSKKHHVSLSDKEYKNFTKNMSSRELREFERRQEEEEDDREWDFFMMSEVFGDDDF